ncbi:MAG: S8 family serine peptidase [Verrucomicrobiota bacterium]|jgi:hypothetical protein|nr:S8 family serine peptidase [Verrucomicrobiota bacterium]
MNWMRKLGWSWVLMMGAWVGQAAEPLRLDWGTLDTSAEGRQQESKTLRASFQQRGVKAFVGEESSAWLVQFEDVILPEWRLALEATGAEIQGYIPENAYLITATPSVMQNVERLPAVYWVGQWRPEYKQSRAVREGLALEQAKRATSLSREATSKEYRILGFDPATRMELAERIASLPGAKVLFVDDLGDRAMVTAALLPAHLEDISTWTDVEWMEPRPVPRAFNDMAMRTNMMNVTNVWSSSGLGLTGKGQIVAVADTGLDTGNLSTLHQDFTNRVTGYGWSNGAYNASYPWADYDSHGTHVAGSVLGSGYMSSGRYRGMAYEASLIFQGCQEDLGGLPSSVLMLFRQAYTAGARIHSDSWGYIEVPGEYIADCRSLDQYVWSNRNFLAVFAASNDGVDANRDGVIDHNSISPPGTSKNCLTVGAAENYRSSSSSWGGSWPDDYPVDPIKSDKISQTSTPQGLAAFSSRGPCEDGRIKPDIVAPGTDIISTRSRRASGTGWGTVSGNTNYLYMGGTSMATPLTSGALALQRQWLVEERGLTDPSAALMKALIISGARNMAPGQYGTGQYQEIPALRPSPSQGYGHVNLYNTLAPGTNMFLELYDAHTLSTGQSNTFTVTVGKANAGDYVFTMAYSDYWATAGSGKKLVNNLDMTVRTPSGQTLYPNGLGQTDKTNNVEMIEFTAEEVGDYVVTVRGQNVPSGSSQPYALVMRGPVTEVLDPVAPVFSPVSASVDAEVGELVEYDFSASLAAGYPAPVFTLSTSVSGAEYEFEDGYLLYAPESMGLKTFSCLASNAAGTATFVLTVSVTPGPPEAPQNLRASATNSTDFTAAWDAVANADGYRLDVSTHAYFASGGMEMTNWIAEGFGTAQPTGWSSSGTGTYSSSPYLGSGLPGMYSIKFDSTGDWLMTPVFPAGASQLQFWAYGNGGAGSVFTIDANIDGVWTLVQAVSIAQSGANYTVALPATATQLRFTFTKVVNGVLDDVVVSGLSGAGGSPEFVPGYSNRFSSTASAVVTGLLSQAQYYFRVCAQSAYGTSPHSDIASVMTLEAETAPVWATIPTQRILVGESLEFDVSPYVSAIPSPSISLVASTAPGADYSSTGAHIVFTPSAAGTDTFTFRASNSHGTHDGLLTVVADPAPVTIPELTLSEATDASFEAAWTPCTDVSTYTLQVATDDQFSTGGSGGTVTLLSNSATTPGSPPAGWTYQLSSSSGSYLQLVAANNYVQSPVFSSMGLTSLSVTFNARTYGGTSGNSAQVTISISTDGGGTWTVLGTRTPANNSLTTQSALDASAYVGHAEVCLKWQTLSAVSSRGVGLAGFVVSGQEAAGTGSLVLDTTVAATHHTVTGLTAETAYYARVRGTSDWSSVETISTQAGGGVMDYEEWLTSQGLDPTDPAFAPDEDEDGDGASNWDEYLADLAPADAQSLFAVEDLPAPASGDQLLFTFPASSNRYYQLIYATNLLGAPRTNNLGWGLPGMVVTNQVIEEWFGTLRVLLAAPEE